MNIEQIKMAIVLYWCEKEETTGKMEGRAIFFAELPSFRRLHSQSIADNAQEFSIMFMGFPNS